MEMYPTLILFSVLVFYPFPFFVAVLTSKYEIKFGAETFS